MNRERKWIKKDREEIKHRKYVNQQFDNMGSNNRNNSNNRLDNRGTVLISVLLFHLVFVGLRPLPQA